MAGAAVAGVAAACFAATAAGSGQRPQCNDSSTEVEHNEVGRIYSGCWDPEYDALTITVTQQPQHGTLTGPDSYSDFRYKPDTSYTGPDEFR